MAASLSNSTTKSIEQAANELFMFSRAQPPSLPAETTTAEVAAPLVEAPAEASPSFSEILRQRFEAQRQQIASHLILINEVRQTIAQLRNLLEKPPPSE